MTCNVGLFTDQAAAVLDDDHRAVVEIADALAGLFAVAHDRDVQFFAGQDATV